MMASKKGGFDLDTIQAATNRGQFLNFGAPIDSEVNAEGDRTETYRIMKEKGSVARACMHGVLDLSTGFLWELVGTPIESALSQEKYYAVKVLFDAENQVKKIELR
jgi:hypothetical protein